MRVCVCVQKEGSRHSPYFLLPDAVLAVHASIVYSIYLFSFVFRFVFGFFSVFLFCNNPTGVLPAIRYAAYTGRGKGMLLTARLRSFSLSLSCPRILFTGYSFSIMSSTSLAFTSAWPLLYATGCAPVPITRRKVKGRVLPSGDPDGKRVQLRQHPRYLTILGGGGATRIKPAECRARFTSRGARRLIIASARHSERRNYRDLIAVRLQSVAGMYGRRERVENRA